MHIHMNKHNKFTFRLRLQKLEGTDYSIDAWVMRQLNLDVCLDTTFMYPRHEMTQVID